MLQIPEQVRQAVAPQAQSPRLKALLGMSSQKLTEAMNYQAEKLEKAGYPNKAILAYQELGPLLLENRAFQTFLRESGSQDLTGLLPDLQDVEELLELARREYGLNREQLESLEQLLTERSPA